MFFKTLLVTLILVSHAAVCFGISQMIYCKMSDWSEWTSCSGHRRKQMRWRKIEAQRYERTAEVNMECSPSPKVTEIRECDAHEPVPEHKCSLTEFGPWTDCRDDNKMYRQRMIEKNPSGKYICNDIPHSILTEEKECPQNPPPPKKCSLTPFGPWTDCKGGDKMYRQRKVQNDPNGRYICDEVPRSLLIESRDCPTPPPQQQKCVWLRGKYTNVGRCTYNRQKENWELRQMLVLRPSSRGRYECDRQIYVYSECVPEAESGHKSDEIDEFVIDNNTPAEKEESIDVFNLGNNTPLPKEGDSTDEFNFGNNRSPRGRPASPGPNPRPHQTTPHDEESEIEIFVFRSDREPDNRARTPTPDRRSHRNTPPHSHNNNPPHTHTPDHRHTPSRHTHTPDHRHTGHRHNTPPHTHTPPTRRPLTRAPTRRPITFRPTPPPTQRPRIIWRTRSPITRRSSHKTSKHSSSSKKKSSSSSSSRKKKKGSSGSGSSS